MLSCKNEIAKIEELAVTPDANFDIAEEPRILYTEKGKRRALIRSTLLKKWNSENPRTEFPKGLRVVFFNGKSDTTILTANYGVNNEQTKEMKVRGNVVVVNYKNEILETEALTWVERDKKIRTKEHVKITTEDEVILGEGMEANENFTNYKIWKTTGIFSVEESN